MDSNLDNSETTQKSVLIQLEGMGEVDVAIPIEHLAERSSQAIENALTTIKEMAKRITSSIQDIPLAERPATVDITFGIKLSSDAKAFIVNAGVEAQIEVKLAWAKKE